MRASIFVSGTKSPLSTYYIKYGVRPFTAHLEQEFQSKLHQSRIRASRGTRYHPEIRIVCGTANRVWRCELGPIKDVEELCAEFQAQPFIASKPGPLKDREVKVTDSLGSQAGVYPRLVAKNEIGRRRKTRRIKPFPKSRSGATRNLPGTPGYDVRARTSTKKRRAIDLAVREYEWEAPLKNRHPVNSPTTHDSVQPSLRAREIPSALA